jgi:FdhE protein
LWILRRTEVAEEKENAWAEKLEREVKALLKDMPEYEKLLAMYKEMLLAQNRAKSRLPEVTVDMDANRAAVCANAGIALLGEVDAELDVEAAEALFGELKEIAAKHGEEYAREAKKIDEAVESGRLDVTAALRQAFEGGPAEELKKEAADLELDPHSLAMLVFSSIRPNLEAYAEKLLPGLDEKDWMKRFCPVCGRLPYMAKLVGDEGRRALCCPACSAEWRYPRIKCANCGTEEQEKLHMLHPEGKSLERCAEVCDNCKRYIKIIDTRKLTEQPVMQLADAGSLHLDVLAQREGFVTL